MNSAALALKASVCSTVRNVDDPTTGFAGQRKAIVVYGLKQTAIKTFQKRLTTQIFVSG
jgi:hypothetical protein